ncbi:MAG: M48 family metallopeptidase [Woeseiaceae bacterium]|nr:M48 family metallopeptidase [Woeseiaceae bacterium]
MNTRRFRSMVHTTLLAGALLGASSVAVAASEAEMEAEAAREFARYKATFPLTTDQDIIDYVACVANAVVTSLEPPDSELNWEMAILETNELNAFVMPGGKIVIFEGIMRAARDQHQLAAVIGHEIAHVTAEHTKRKLLQGGKGMEIGIQVAAVLLGGGNYGAQYTAHEMLNQGAMYGLLLPYKRSQETEADVIGLEYMAKAGFDPRAAVPLWQNMAEQSGGERPAEFASTHPSPDNRIESLISQWVEVLPLYNQAHAEGRIPDCPTPEVVLNRYQE